MVMASLAWSLKAWLALILPVNGRLRTRHQIEKEKLLKMEFRSFVNALIHIPAQIIRKGRRIIYRILSWNPWLKTFFRLFDVLQR